VKRKSKESLVTQGSGNVFADLGLPNPEQEMLKAHLTLQIHSILKKRGLTQAEAAKLLHIQQPRVSQLLRNRPGSFSVARLMELLTMLGQDVKISVEPARKRRGEMVLVARAAYDPAPPTAARGSR
jgi:predicted XRE-type DNA-binding protein